MRCHGCHVYFCVRLRKCFYPYELLMSEYRFTNGRYSCKSFLKIQYRVISNDQPILVLYKKFVYNRSILRCLCSVFQFDFLKWIGIEPISTRFTEYQTLCFCGNDHRKRKTAGSIPGFHWQNDNVYFKIIKPYGLVSIAWVLLILYWTIKRTCQGSV